METRLQLRQHYKIMRDAMPLELQTQLSMQLSKVILQWEIYQQANTVFFYYSLGSEASLLPVIHDAIAQKKQIAFPKVFGNKMAFYKIKTLDELKEGSFHVMEPAGEGQELLCQDPDLCFVPGIVFDKAGGRFGYGKGYYDRYFAGKRKGKLVGCAYECQIIDKLPVCDWDQKMDYLVNETGIIDVANGELGIEIKK